MELRNLKKDGFDDDDNDDDDDDDDDDDEPRIANPSGSSIARRAIPWRTETIKLWGISMRGGWGLVSRPSASAGLRETTDK
ncbi:hypothetical protein M0804_003747 [Polistes exclamans]|nr:hypothetical protein M0804_003747 [Polistes exclamans]